MMSSDDRLWARMRSGFSRIRMAKMRLPRIVALPMPRNPSIAEAGLTKACRRT